MPEENSLLKRDKVFYLINGLITLFCTAAVISIRFDVMPTYVEIGVVNVSICTFFFIICGALCGVRYGIFMFSCVFISEIVKYFSTEGVRDRSQLITLFVYLLAVLAASYLSYSRWFTTVPRFIGATFMMLILTMNEWYLIYSFIVAQNETLYEGMEMDERLLGSNPEVILGCLMVFLIFRFIPDRAKARLGMGYYYTSECTERRACEKEVRKRTLGSKVTAMSMIEALLLAVICVALFDMQLINPNANRFEAGKAIGRQFEEDAAFGKLFFMNGQLIMLILSIALPIAILFNQIILRLVVHPINKISNLMDKFFEGDRGALEEHLEMVNRLHIHSGDEMEKLTHNMQKMIHDMSEHIDALEKERQLEADLKVAEAKSEAKSTFLSNMSHEIRTPINAVLGMDEMILRESKEENTIYYAENIKTAGNTLLGLVNDILDFSKIEAGKLDLIETDYDFASTLNDLVTMIQTRADDKGLNFEVEVASDMPHLLHGDEIRLKQIITNILTNAVKYTEEGGVTLTVDFDRVKKESEDEPDRIALIVSVKDTGIGIKEEDIKKLFVAFERIEEERNRTIEGTGLGMNITQSLLHMMGSSLKVESVYGEGSDFSFVVNQEVRNFEPIGDYKESLKKAIASRKVYRESFVAPDADILVVDDTQMNLVVIENLLKKTKVRIDTALSGFECLAKTRKKKYDLIFLDHRMPEKDGLETLKELLEEEDNINRDTPAVCLTANAVSGARELYEQAGFKDYLTKPVDAGRLEETLVKFLPADKVTMVTDDGEENRPDLSSIPEFIRNIEEIDLDVGVQNCGGAEDFTVAAKTYLESIDSYLKEIKEYYDNSDIEHYTIKVHALKSSSRIIGALDLSRQAEAMEAAGNAGDVPQIRANTEKLLVDLKALGEKLAPLSGEGEDNDADKPLINDDELNEAVSALKDFAASFDYDNFKFVLDSMGDYRLPETEKARYNELKKAINALDWDKISEVLK